jgi:hypothetical protein
MCTHLQGSNDILNIVPSVCRQCFRDNKQSICESLDTKLAPSFRFTLDSVVQVCCACDLECACTRNQTLVFESILDAPKTISDSILDLADGVCVGSYFMY